MVRAQCYQLPSRLPPTNGAAHRRKHPSKGGQTSSSPRTTSRAWASPRTRSKSGPRTRPSRPSLPSGSVRPAFPNRDILSVLGGPPPANTEKMQSSSPSSSSAVSSSRSSRAFSCDDQRTTRTGGSKNGRIYTKVSSADWPCVPARGMLAMHAPAGARPTVCEGWARGGELAKSALPCTTYYYLALFGKG